MKMLHRSFNQFRIHWSCPLPFNNFKWGQNHGLGVHSPRYFHTTNSVINYPHQIHFPFQMSGPSIVKCYEEKAEDPTLLCQFPPEEYSSVQALPCLGTLQFRLVSEGFFACIASPDKWGRARVEFHNWSEDEWSNHQHGNPHHWWGGQEGLRSGDGFMSSQGQDGGPWCPFSSMPMWLIRA